MVDNRSPCIHDPVNLRDHQVIRMAILDEPRPDTAEALVVSAGDAMARTHGRKGRPWERLAHGVIGLWISQGKPCPRCGQAIDPVGTWPARHRLSPSVDHIVPLSVDRSRAHDPSNLRVMHYGCNAARGDGTRDSIKRTW